MIEQEHFWEARCIFLKMLKRYELSFQEIYKHPDNPELAEDFKENFTVQNVTDGQDFYYKFSLKQKENGNILAIGKFGKSKKGELAIRSALACGLVLNDLHERYQLSNFLYTYGGLTWQQEEYTRTMVLFQYINGGTSFDDLLSAGMLSTKDIRGVLVQLAYAIGKAYSVCAFLHGNINCKNIIIQTLKEPVVVRNEAFVLKIRYIPIISGFGLNSSFSWGNASYNVKFIANPIADELKPVFERMSEVFPSNRNLFLKLMGCSDAEIFSIIFQM
jgi:hypothetical protein